MKAGDIIGFTALELDNGHLTANEYAGIVTNVYPNGRFVASIAGQRKRFELAMVCDLAIVGSLPAGENVDETAPAVIIPSNRRFSIPLFRVGYQKPADFDLFLDWRIGHGNA